MTLADPTNLPATMDDAYKVAGFVIAMTTAAMDPMRLNVHRQNVIRLNSSNARRNTAWQPNGDAMENWTVPMGLTREWVYYCKALQSTKAFVHRNVCFIIPNSEFVQQIIRRLVCIRSVFKLSPRHKSCLLFFVIETHKFHPPNKRFGKCVLLVERSETSDTQAQHSLLQRIIAST